MIKGQVEPPDISTRDGGQKLERPRCHSYNLGICELSLLSVRSLANLPLLGDIEIVVGRAFGAVEGWSE